MHLVEVAVGDPVLVADDVRKSFGDGRRTARVEAVRGVSLTVRPGEFVAVVGASGSGKSTLLHLLSALERPTSGEVLLAGQPTRRLSAARLSRLRIDRIGFVFQQFNLIPSLSARENVALPLRLARDRDAPAKADAALASVGLSERGSHRPGVLSGGEQQRVAIARVLASEPAIVFADEPTGSLDGQASGTVLELLRTAAGGTRSVVMVTHDLDAAARADRVLVIRDGRLHVELLAPDRERIWDAMAAAGTDEEVAR
ncbi:ABC transporter ATP-binding protein [Rathayibacter sp. VKM Ac-2630]|uniref:ABC transporter ATP-binding protein n=1 Tax=Rathayibacter sp. VKM Ac-2630 TaxID=1938617 RepID=UPI0009810714|nr:ABC transporter ATP-binding protein [Rathayibacter sp. VKM Ac-2630]OOB89649.1 ABC transporter [Rathayibacter sp. VKM Ac-2630]